MKWVSGLVFMVVMLFSNIAAAENCQGEKLNIFIQGLDKTKVESVLKFSEEIKAYSKGKEFACVEPFIVYFVSFYQESLYEFSKANGIWDSSYPMPSKKKDELVSRIKQVGWDLMESEGAYYIAEQGDWISKEFEPILNQPWKDYFALETVEIKESFCRRKATEWLSAGKAFVTGSFIGTGLWPSIQSFL